MDAAPWPQGLVQDIKLVKSMDEISSRPIVERKSRPQEQLNCPRCNSTNTKFCYYNNYSLTQPRYFCKTCRRYWTEGGSLRNVPVGGGSRKNKRFSSSVSSATTATSAASSATSISKKLPDLNPPSISQFSTQNPKVLEGQDLNLAFPAMEESQALELIRTGVASRGSNSFIPAHMSDSNALYSSGFAMQEFKQTLSFGVEGLGVGNRYGGIQENGGKINFFPLGELKQFSSSNHHEADHQNKGHAVNSSTTNTNTTPGGFWNGMFNGGGGGSW